MYFPLLLLIITSVSLATETIKYAAVIYRHGDRTPVDTYPTDPWRNESLWPEKFGELTNKGKMQHFNLGKWLRNRYSRILSESYDPSEIYVKSTDVDRTLMSAEANLAGMYPPVAKDTWNNELMWQPIPVHTEPEEEDYILAMKKKCLAYDREMQKYVESQAYKQRLRRYQDLMNYLTAYTGRKIKDYYDIESIYSILYIESLYNFTLPDWTKSVYPDKMKEPSGYSFSTSAATPLLARLRAGPLIKEIFSKITKASAKNSTKSPLKVSIYSGHDFTVGTLLTALGMFDGNCPVYTSTVLIELVNDSVTSDFIRISYRNSIEIVEPQVLDIPYCGKRCPVERFKKLYENLLTVRFDRECAKQYNSLLGITFLAGIGLCGIIYSIHKICYAKMYRESRPSCIYTSANELNKNPAVKFVDL